MRMFEPQYCKCSRVCTFRSSYLGCVDCRERTHRLVICGRISSVVASFLEYCLDRLHRRSRVIVLLSCGDETHTACKRHALVATTTASPL